MVGSQSDAKQRLCGHSNDPDAAMHFVESCNSGNRNAPCLQLLSLPLPWFESKTLQGARYLITTTFVITTLEWVRSTGGGQGGLPGSDGQGADQRPGGALPRRTRSLGGHLCGPVSLRLSRRPLGHPLSHCCHCMCAPNSGWEVLHVFCMYYVFYAGWPVACWAGMWMMEGEWLPQAACYVLLRPPAHPPTHP